MHFAFLLDSSVSMNAPFSPTSGSGHGAGGLSYWECAKAAVDHFLKTACKLKGHERNRFLLMTYAEAPGCFESTFTEDAQHLLHRLKGIQATDLSDPGPALARLFDYLHSQRLLDQRDGQDAVQERPGTGWYPGNSSSTIIFWITRSSMHFVTGSGTLTSALQVPGLSSPGAEGYVEPFRWDQRLYTLVLDPQAPEDMGNSSASAPGGSTAPALQQIRTMTLAMAGRLWSFPSVRLLLACMENCLGVSRPRPEAPPAAPFCHIEGVWLNFAELPVDPADGTALPASSASVHPPLAREERVLLYCNRSVPQSFPIPESPCPGPGAAAKHVGGAASHRKRAHPRIAYSPRDTVYHIPEGFPVDRLGMEPSAMGRGLMRKKAGVCWPLYVLDSHSKKGPGYPFGFLKVSSVGNSVNLYLLPYNFPRLFKLLFALKSYATSSGSNKIPSKWKLEFLHYLKDIPTYYVPLVRRAMASPTNVPSTAHIWAELGLAEGPEASTTIAGEGEERAAETYSLAIRAAVQSQQLRLATDLQLHRLMHPCDPTPPPRRFHLPISVMGDYHPHLARSTLPRNPLEEEEVIQRRARQLFGNPYRVDPKVPVSIDEEDEAARMDEEEQERARQQHQQQLTPPPAEVDGSLWALSVASSTTSGLWKRKPRRRLVFPLTPFQWDKVPRLAVNAGEPLLFVPPVTLPAARVRKAEEAELEEVKANEAHIPLTYANIKRACYPDMREQTALLLERIRQEQAAAVSSLPSSASTIGDGPGAEDDTAAFVRELEAETSSMIFQPSLPALQEAVEGEEGGCVVVDLTGGAQRVPSLGIKSPPALPLNATGHGKQPPQLLQQQESAMLDLRLSIKRLIQRAGPQYSQADVLAEVRRAKAHPLLTPPQLRLVLDASVEFARRFQKGPLVQALLDVL